MSILEAMIAADRKSADDRDYWERQRQFNVNQNRMDNNSNIIQQQFLAGQQRDAERLNASIAQQNADREIRSFQLNEESNRRNAADKRSEEMFNKYELPYEEAKLQSLKETQEQQRQSKLAREERKALLKEEGLINLVAGLRMGLPIQRIGDKFNSRGQAKAQKIDYNPDTHEVNIIDGDGNPRYISGDMFDEIASYGDEGYSSTGKSTGTRSSSNSRSISSGSGKLSAPKEWNPKDEVEALKGLDELIIKAQYDRDDPKSTDKQKESAMERIKIYNEKIDKINSRSDDKPNSRIISYGASLAQGNPNEITDTVKGRPAVFNVQTKQFVRWADTPNQGITGISPEQSQRQAGTWQRRKGNLAPYEQNMEFVPNQLQSNQIVVNQPNYKQALIEERVSAPVMQQPQERDVYSLGIGTIRDSNAVRPSEPINLMSKSDIKELMKPEKGNEDDRYYKAMSLTLKDMQSDFKNSSDNKERARLMESIIRQKQKIRDYFNKPNNSPFANTRNPITDVQNIYSGYSNRVKSFVGE